MQKAFDVLMYLSTCKRNTINPELLGHLKDESL